MQIPADIQEYLIQHSKELGERILSSFPPLHGIGEPMPPVLGQMLRRPYPAQALAIMGISKRWQIARDAHVVAECGSGKSLIALGAMLAHSAEQSFSAVVMAPPHLVPKWVREGSLTLPGVRLFVIDDMRNGGDPKQPHGVNEVRIRKGEMVREGMRTSLSELRRLGREGWRKLCPQSSIFCMGRDKAKLSYFWKHCYGRSRSGNYRGALTNPDTGCPIETDGVRFTAMDFDKRRLHEIVEDSKGGNTKYSALWQADRTKIVRMAPAKYIGRYMFEWFDYAIADEIHQLAGDTAQGNALGALARAAKHLLGLTGTLLSGYADDLFNTLFRCNARKMIESGYEWGHSGRERFTRDFGVIETIERIAAEDNACSKNPKKTVTVRRRPGASPLLFGQFLMANCAFITLENISDALPPYREEVVSVAMEEPLQSAYQNLEQEISACLRQHRGNRSVLSTMLNTLLCYPDHPYGLGMLYGSEYDPESRRREQFIIAETVDLNKQLCYAKERALIQEVKFQLERTRKCHIFSVYTTKHDVTARLESLLRAEGIRAAVLRASVPTHKREAWYREQLRRGVDVVVAHPKLVETGLDVLDFPVILFHETGYSLHTLRQASRRSWRIGQRSAVDVKFYVYKNTAQEICIKLMGKKLLVALAMEGKFTSEGLHAIDGDDDMLTAMARELVENKRIGESAESIWRNLAELQPSAGKPVESEPVAEMPPVIVSDIGAFDSPGTFDSVPVSAPMEDLLRASGETDEAVQLPLF